MEFAKRCGESLPLTKMCEKNIWVFPKIGVPQNGWCIMENPVKMDDLKVPQFSETSIWKYDRKKKSSQEATASLDSFQLISLSKFTGSKAVPWATFLPIFW